VPTVEFPPGIPSTKKLMVMSVAFVIVTLNLTTPPVNKEDVMGLSVTVIGGGGTVVVELPDPPALLDTPPPFGTPLHAARISNRVRETMPSTAARNGGRSVHRNKRGLAAACRRALRVLARLPCNPAVPAIPALNGMMLPRSSLLN
jgi:hypothetical protein